MKSEPRPPEAHRELRSDAPPSANLDWVAPEGAGGIVTGYVEQLLLRKRRRRWAMVGTAAAIVIMGGLVWLSRPVSKVDAPARRPAVVSLPQRQELSDGSVVELNYGAEISTDFTDAIRAVTLKRGEALFQVAKAADRPFVVTAGQVRVRAVGTAFAVQLGAAAVDVLVTEGQVAVTSEEKNTRGAVASTAGAAEPLIDVKVSAGNRVTVLLVAEPSVVKSAPAPAKVVSVPPAEVMERLAWRVPRVELSYTPLGNAIEIFSKHSGVRVTLADSTLAQLELSGNLRADNIGSLLQLLAEEFGIKADRRGNEITLRR